MEKKRLLQKAVAQKTAEQRAREAINADYAEAPADQYDASGMAEAVNAVTKSGEPLRKKYEQISEEQMAADKKAYEEMMVSKKKALFHRKK